MSFRGNISIGWCYFRSLRRFDGFSGRSHSLLEAGSGSVLQVMESCLNVAQYCDPFYSVHVSPPKEFRLMSMCPLWLECIIMN